MKKIYILILLLFLWFSVSNASSIGDVFVSFCNSGVNNRSLNFVAKAGSPYELCLKFSTTSQEKIPVNFSFVAGETTDDDLHRKACSNEGGTFSSYTSFPSYSVIVSSGTSLFITGTLSFPLGYSGEVHGCLVYTIPTKTHNTKKNAALFDVIVRKANFIDGRVMGNFSRKLSFESDSVNHYIDKIDNSLVVVLPLKNNGVLSEYLQFTGTLKNSLGYERSVTSSQVVNYLTSSQIIFRFSDIPFYKGLYKFNFSGSSVLDTTLDLSYIPNDIKVSQYFSYENNFVIIPRNFIFWIGGFFVALFLLRRILRIILRR